MGRIFSEANIAYLAGLIDGDGAIMATIESHREKKFRFRVRVILKVTQKDSKVLRQLQNEFLIGYVVQNRTTCEWVIKDQKAVSEVLFKLQRYLRIKKRQASIAIKILASRVDSKNDLLKIAKMADSLASFNVRSKNRRLNYMTKIKENIPRND